jgi:hypothetical protein
VDDYCVARSGIIPPLPWTTFSPPFSVSTEHHTDAARWPIPDTPNRINEFTLNNTHTIDFALKRCGSSRHSLQGFV